MCKCFICDSQLEKPEFDARYNPLKIDPCPKCLDIIYRTAHCPNDDEVAMMEEEFDDYGEPERAYYTLGENGHILETQS